MTGKTPLRVPGYDIPVSDARRHKENGRVQIPSLGTLRPTHESLIDPAKPHIQNIYT